MISNDERRDFARRLREIPLGTGVQHGLLALSRAMYPTNRERFDHQFGHGNSSSKRAFLVGAVERPTCEDIGDERAFVCSDCHCRVDRWHGDVETDPITPTMMVSVVGPISPHYCPNCGAEVVE